MRTAYQSRVLKQLLLWVNGINVHNKTDNECTPDFSCCDKLPDPPSLEDRQKVLATYIRRINLRS